MLTFWLADVAGRPVGFVDLAIVVRPPRPGHAAIRRGYLDSAFVLEPYRNHGVGTTLLNAMLDHARHRDIARVLLYPTAKSVPFYQRAGFDILPTDPKIRMVRTTAGPEGNRPHPDTVDPDLNGRGSRWPQP